jgi:hypothetical protein
MPGVAPENHTPAAGEDCLVRAWISRNLHERGTTEGFRHSVDDHILGSIGGFIFAGLFGCDHIGAIGERIVVSGQVDVALGEHLREGVFEPDDVASNGEQSGDMLIEDRS